MNPQNHEWKGGHQVHLPRCWNAFRGLDVSAPGHVIGAVSQIVVKGEMFKVIGSGAVEVDPDPDH